MDPPFWVWGYPIPSRGPFQRKYFSLATPAIRRQNGLRHNFPDGTDVGLTGGIAFIERRP